MRKPYLKKIGDFAGYAAWLVDGEYVRNKIDREFCNLAEHYRFSFIPKKELWIDRERVPGEAKYFIDNLLARIRLIEQGVEYDDALERASRIETRERRKDFFRRRRRENYEAKKEILKKVRKRLIKKYSHRAIAIWLVNAEAVRTLFDSDFTEGGHDLVYPYIPPREIWLDDDLMAGERKFVVLHEIHERNLMAQGWAYDSNDFWEEISKKKKRPVHKSAHRSASQIEYSCRKKPEMIEDKIKQEMNLALKLYGK